MSRLENSVKDLLIAMIKGRELTIGSNGRALLSAWAVKTAMLFEHSVPGANPYWQPHERRAFSEPPHWPPGDIAVFAATYQGSYLAMYSGGEHRIATLSGRGAPVPATRATVVVGHLVLHVLADRWTEVTGRMAFRMDLAGLDKTVPLWPVGRPVEWPGRPPLDNESLTELHTGRSRTAGPATEGVTHPA